ncbi:MAG: hypothetical protein AAGI12_06940 [Pseudomonadota bacterium]
MSPTPKILILTPVKNAVDHWATYWRLIERLDWPKNALSLGVLESDSNDGTFDLLQRVRPIMEQRLSRVTLHKRDFNFQIPKGLPRWEPAFQLARRQVLARSRNHLLFAALRDEDWVMWIDVDMIDFPSNTIQRLLAHERDIIQPHCVLEPGGDTFDLNAWTHNEDQTEQKPLSQARGSNRPVRLDSVGGCLLMVKADLHRDGLVFPPYPYGRPSPKMREQHPVWGTGEIETEGLAMMAHDMGVQCWGLPDFEVIHHNG